MKDVNERIASLKNEIIVKITVPYCMAAATLFVGNRRITVKYVRTKMFLVVVFCILLSTQGQRIASLERLRYPGSGLRVRVSPFCLPIFADVCIFTRNFYPFPPR